MKMNRKQRINRRARAILAIINNPEAELTRDAFIGIPKDEARMVAERAIGWARGREAKARIQAVWAVHSLLLTLEEAHLDLEHGVSDDPRVARMTKEIIRESGYAPLVPLVEMIPHHIYKEG